MLSQERQRLMQDMHDGLGSSLVSALRVVEDGRLQDMQVAEVLKSCIDDLKLAIDSMEPVEADLLLLLATLRFRLGSRLESTGIILRWEISDVPALDWLDPRNALHILRILQEAFANILKHAQASEIRVTTGAAKAGSASASPTTARASRWRRRCKTAARACPTSSAAPRP
jgi:signal transduction histidine kinase